MSSTTPGPFGPETLDEIKQHLKELDDADVLLDQAARAGIDMSSQKAKSADIRQQILRFRQAFFPGK